MAAINGRHFGVLHGFSSGSLAEKISFPITYDYRRNIPVKSVLASQLTGLLCLEGQGSILIRDGETIEKLNESGELRRILKPFRSADACSECRVCGGYRLLPCAVCNGSKKSVHRNDFTAEFMALKCMNCDEVGLVKCYSC
uniref:Uncharacterized protein n=1 Tax=Timema monikensis TaxID=170555 RepID=A0A7R9E520_9NEOP|nr:unnamed protein product [Timema monikensis]